jgi:hypothetical protein
MKIFLEVIDIVRKCPQKYIKVQPFNFWRALGFFFPIRFVSSNETKIRHEKLGTLL